MTPRNPRRPKAWTLASLIAAPFCLALGFAAAGPPSSLARVLGGAPAPLGALSAAQELDGRPLSASDLRGKVVVVNFWTYSCINSLRALPYLRAWSDRYKDRGLVVVGVHAPEFGFEHDPGNVRRASADLGVHFPVVLDSDFRLWRAFGNDAWPAFYVIGADGRLRGRAIGEGGYAETEQLIRKLLAENDARPLPPTARITATGPQAPPDLADLRSGETYVGYDKASGLAAGRLKADARQVYPAPSALALNRWALTGAWTAGPESARGEAAGAAITYRFHARDLHMVLAPAADGRPIRYRIRIDGAPPGADHGVDTAGDGAGVVRAPRMYQLVRQARPVADRTFEIQFLDPGARAFVFTFG